MPRGQRSGCRVSGIDREEPVMSTRPRQLGRLMVGLLTLVPLLGLGPAALAGGPIHDPGGRGFPVLSTPPDHAPVVWTTAPQGFGWMAQGATVALLAAAALACWLALASRRHAHSLARPR